MNEQSDKWNKAERLAVAGHVAPRLRDQAERAAKRRVALTDKDGNVVRYTTLAEVQASLLLQKKIELEVIEGKRQAEYICEECGTLVRRPNPKATGGKRCDACSFLSCADCGKKLPRCYSAPSFVKKRKGRPPYCGECAAKHRKKKPLPVCETCKKTLHRTRQPNADGRLFCSPCKNRMKREATARAHPCANCGQPLPLKKIYQGGKYCSGCYTTERRKETVAQKLKDPTFAAKVAENLAKGREIKRCKQKG